MEKLMNMVEKMFPGDEAAQAKAVAQLQQFRSMQDLFGRSAAQECCSPNAALCPVKHIWIMHSRAAEDCSPGPLTGACSKSSSSTHTATCLGQYVDLLANR